MRLAAVSDIHGELVALKAVWRDIVDRKLAECPVINAGDTVAYGPDTMACIDFARNPVHKMISVGGNYDFNVARFPEKRVNYQRKWAKLRPDKYAALRDASSDLTDDARRWLSHLPKSEVINVKGVKICVSHYAPTPEKEGLFATTSTAHLCKLADELQGTVDVVVTGHTHTPFVRRAGGVLFVNPGSVGRSFGTPTYSEITIEEGKEPSARIITCPVTPLSI